MGVFFKSASWAPPAAQLRGSFEELLVKSPPRDEAEKKNVLAQYMKPFEKSATALEPRVGVFIAAGVLVVILLVATIWVASAADAQSVDLAKSQLKTLSTALIAAFSSLSGAIVGMITGEAVGKKE